MAEYFCVDGPLAGHSVWIPGSHVGGAAVVLEVVDYGQGHQDVPLFDYIVDVGPDQEGTGRLRHARLDA